MSYTVTSTLGWSHSGELVNFLMLFSSLFCSASTPEHQPSLVVEESPNLKGEVEPSSTEASYSSTGTDQYVPSPTQSTSSNRPSVSPLPRVKSPRKVSNDPPATPGSRSKKSSPLPRVAMLAQNSAKKPVEPKKSSPPPFRAGGKTTALQEPPRRSMASRTSSASSILARDQSRQSSMRSTAGTRSAKFAERPQWGTNHTPPTKTTQSRTMTPSSGSRRAIAKPPENIKRALQESKALSKMDSLESQEDSDIQNLKSILQDIKTIKSELGVESETAEKEDHGNDATAESALSTKENGVEVDNHHVENRDDDLEQPEDTSGTPEEECVPDSLAEQTTDDGDHDDSSTKKPVDASKDDPKDGEEEEQNENEEEGAAQDENDEDDQRAMSHDDVDETMASLSVEASEKPPTTTLEELEPEIKAKQLCSCSIM